MRYFNTILKQKANIFRRVKFVFRHGSTLKSCESSSKDAQDLQCVKAGFHMIADRRSQIAIRSAIVCDHMETTSAIDRRR